MIVLLHASACGPSSVPSAKLPSVANLATAPAKLQIFEMRADSKLTQVFVETMTTEDPR